MHHNVFRLKFLQPKLTRFIIRLLCILLENFNSMHQELRELTLSVLG